MAVGAAVPAWVTAIAVVIAAVGVVAAVAVEMRVGEMVEIGKSAVTVEVEGGRVVAVGGWVEAGLPVKPFTACALESVEPQPPMRASPITSVNVSPISRATRIAPTFCLHNTFLIATNIAKVVPGLCWWLK